MHRLINEIIVALENKEYCTALFIDMEKAFDKINHESLLQTIRKQFPEKIHQLIKSYLSSRTFVIKIKDTHSQVKDIKAGVPQGSVLGPILYTLYMANIPTTTNSTVLTFADDTAILVRHTIPRNGSQNTTRIYHKNRKLATRKTKVNPNKCNHITFTLQKKIPPNILLNGTHITQTKHVKYLGLHLDTQLTWKLHIKSIVEKIQKTRRQMHWLTSRKSKLSIENKLKIYKTIIKPIWTYGIPLWGTAAISHINKIKVMQAKILKTIVNGPWYVRNKDIRRDLGIPTVKEEISRYSEKYKSRRATHPNRLAAETYKTINMDRRLKRKHPADLIKDIT